MKHKKVQKLLLNRETLRNLQPHSLEHVAGGATRVCPGTEESVCHACYTTDVTDCPGCVFTGVCLSLDGCQTGVGSACTC